MPRGGVDIDGSRLREMRQDAGWDMRQFASLVGVDRHSVYRFERGMMRPSPATLRRMALALRVKPADLRRGVEAQATRGA